MGLIQLYLVENEPWVLWCDLSWSGFQKAARVWGEWAWVGRES
jgi:hypothetical protein